MFIFYATNYVAFQLLSNTKLEFQKFKKVFKCKILPGTLKLINQHQ